MQNVTPVRALLEIHDHCDSCMLSLVDWFNWCYAKLSEIVENYEIYIAMLPCESAFAAMLN